MNTNRQVNQPLLGGSTLHIIVVGMAFAVLIAVGIYAYKPIPPTAAEAPINLGSGESQIAETQATEIPTAEPTATATEMPTEIPSSTPTPDPWATWPDLADMAEDPRGLLTISPELRMSREEIDENYIKNGFYDIFLTMHEQYIGRNDEANVLHRLYTDSEITGALRDYYSKIFVEPYHEDDPMMFVLNPPFENVYGFVTFIPTAHTDADITEEGKINTNFIPLYSLWNAHIMYLMSTDSELCLFLEDTTLRGYGPAGIPDWSIAKQIVVLIETHGSPSSEFRCSNFDPASRDFLAMTRQVGLMEIYHQVLDLLDDSQ